MLIEKREETIKGYAYVLRPGDLQRFPVNLYPAEVRQ